MKSRNSYSVKTISTGQSYSRNMVNEGSYNQPQSCLRLRRSYYLFDRVTEERNLKEEEIATRNTLEKELEVTGKVEETSWREKSRHFLINCWLMEHKLRIQMQ